MAKKRHHSHMSHKRGSHMSHGGKRMEENSRAGMGHTPDKPGNRHGPHTGGMGGGMMSNDYSKPSNMPTEFVSKEMYYAGHFLPEDYGSPDEGVMRNQDRDGAMLRRNMSRDQRY